MEFSSTVKILICCIMVKAASMDNPIPFGWENMCTSRIDPGILGFYVDNVPKDNHVIRMQCNIIADAGKIWRFQTLRERLQGLPNISVFLQVRCSEGEKISLPWPMKATGLVGLVVSNCILTDKYADFGNQDVAQIADQLRVLEMRNSVWLSDDSAFDKITSTEGLASLTSDYDCGQDSTIEYIVTSNVSHTLIPPEEEAVPSRSVVKSEDKQNLDLMKLPSTGSDLQTDSSDLKFGGPYSQAVKIDFDRNASEAASLPGLIDSDLLNNNVKLASNVTDAAQEEFLNLLERLASLDLRCNYEKLKFIDESFPHLLPVQHFKLMVKDAKYPELRIMNYSRAGIRKLPQELADFRVYFPKLKYLDLSRNYLTEINLPLRSMGTEGEFMTLNVRNNLITNISVEDIVAWSNIEGVLVDVRDNPIHCGCHIDRLLREIKSDTFFVGQLQKYDYIRELECASPSHLKGQKLSKLNLQCALNNHVTDSSVPMGIFIGSSVTVVVIVVAVFFAAVVVNHHHYHSGHDIFKTNDDVAKTVPGMDVEDGDAITKTKV